MTKGLNSFDRISHALKFNKDQDPGLTKSKNRSLKY